MRHCVARGQRAPGCLSPGSQKRQPVVHFRAAADGQGVLAYKGRLGSELSIAEGQAACRLAAINCLAVLKNNLADWGQLVKIVKITGYIQCEAHFTELPLVLNGASQLLEDIFGEYGKHARVAVGVNALPLGAACEVEMLAELR